jgi:galactose mutarotase-like enzyme
VPLDARGLPSADAAPSPSLVAGDVPCCHGDDALFERADAGRGTATVHLPGRHVRVDIGREYPFLQLYSPAATGSGVACVEPMVAATSALTDGRAPIVRAGAALHANFTLSITNA